jgi:hypothetical protein
LFSVKPKRVLEAAAKLGDKFDEILKDQIGYFFIKLKPLLLSMQILLPLNPETFEGI